MKTEMVQSVVLLLIAVCVFIAGEYKKHASTSQVVKVWAANCAFPDPGAFREGPFPPSMLWCEEDKQPIINLMNHMKLYSTEMDASIGSEFGVNIKIGYLTLPDLFLINPKITDKSETMIECTDSVGNIAVKQFRPEQVTVEYTSMQFKKSSTRFVDGDACLVQLMLDTMQ